MSGRFKPAANTYVRPMAGWWRKNPYFILYMIREGSAIFLAAYALVLLAGLFCLSLGEGAYNVWRAALDTKLSVALWPGSDPGDLSQLHLVQGHAEDGAGPAD
jgi:hypothetical protein